MSQLVCSKCERVGKIQLLNCTNGKFIFGCTRCDFKIETSNPEDYETYKKNLYTVGKTMSEKPKKDNSKLINHKVLNKDKIEKEKNELKIKLEGSEL